MNRVRRIRQGKGTRQKKNVGVAVPRLKILNQSEGKKGRRRVPQGPQENNTICVSKSGEHCVPRMPENNKNGMIPGRQTFRGITHHAHRRGPAQGSDIQSEMAEEFHADSSKVKKARRRLISVTLSLV